MALGTSTFNKIEASTGTSTSAVLSHTPTAGSIITVTATAFYGAGTEALAVSDATNGAYTKIDSAKSSNGVNGNGLGQFYHLSVAATAASMTINGGAAANGVVGVPTELTGYTTVTVDKPVTPHATGTGTAVTSQALTNSQATSIYLHSVTSEASGATTFTPGSSFTSVGSETNGASFSATDSADLNVTTASSRTATETLGSSLAWASIIAAYSDTPAAGGGGLPFFLQIDLLVGQFQSLSGGFQKRLGAVVDRLRFYAAPHNPVLARGAV